MSMCGHIHIFVWVDICMWAYVMETIENEENFSLKFIKYSFTSLWKEAAGFSID